MVVVIVSFDRVDVKHALGQRQTGNVMSHADQLFALTILSWHLPSYAYATMTILALRCSALSLRVANSNNDSVGSMDLCFCRFPLRACSSVPGAVDAIGVVVSGAARELCVGRLATKGPKPAVAGAKIPIDLEVEGKIRGTFSIIWTSN